MMIQWRDFLIGEIQDKLRKNHNFFEGSNDAYESSALKRIITRFEYILNTYLREFVHISIYDWVSFIRHFTNPNLNNDELWRVNDTPCIVIHFSIKKKEKKKEKAGKKKDKKDKGKDGEEAPPADEEEGKESDDDEKNRIIYKPSIQECHDFVLNGMNMIIESTNSVNSLESDLMPFLQKEEKSNFKIDKSFEWIKDASQTLDTLISQNIGGPNELLAKYKEYERIINVEKKELIKSLFEGGEDGGKVSLEEIKEKILEYEQAHYEIMTLSEDEVDFRIFRVMAKRLKEQLAEAAAKIKQEILDATYKHCTDTVTSVFKTYNEMQDKITHEPINEKELKESKEFNQLVMTKVDELQEILKEVYRHFLMLEEFSYMYKEQDIEGFWYMRVWPMKIQDCLKDGKDMVNEKNELFSIKLAQEQETFTK